MLETTTDEASDSEAGGLGVWRSLENSVKFRSLSVHHNQPRKRSGNRSESIRKARWPSASAGDVRMAVGES